MSGQLKSKRLQYSPSKMANALSMVKSGAMSRRKAAITYGVPRTTLIDKLSGRVPEERTSPGPKTVLTGAEEKVLVDYIKLMASIGYPLSREDLLNEVKKIIDIDGRQTPFKENKPGKDWFYAFKKRHPELSERFAMNLGHQRAFVNIDMVENWFKNLNKYLRDEVPGFDEMIKDPRRVFNADESGFPLCFKTGKVLAQTGARHVYRITTSNKQQLTVMVCFNAFGDFVPPLIVYPGERFRDTGISSFPEAIYGHSSNGWMDSELFVAFLHEFSQYITDKTIQKPVILFVDGHSTHMTRSAAEFCSENGIVLYCLLPNATHILQPCDVGLFSPMKSAWKKHVKIWQMDNIGQNLSKKEFPKVFKSAWEAVTTMENAARAFRRTGLFPLDPSGVDLSKLEPSKVANPITASLNTIQQPQEAETTPVSNPHQENQMTAETPCQQNEKQMPSPSSQSSDLPTPAGDADAGDKEIIQHPTGSSPKIHVVASTSKASQFFVSPAFEHLKVPEPKARKQVQTINQKLPKALSGSTALKMFEEREQQKAAEIIRKQKRKEELDRKRKEKEQLADKRKKEREEKKKRKEIEKKVAQWKKEKRQKRESSSSDESCVPYMDSDSFDESNICPGCKTDDTLEDSDEWIKCCKCHASWHVVCTGEALLFEIPVAQLQNYPYYCENCI